MKAILQHRLNTFKNLQLAKQRISIIPKYIRVNVNGVIKEVHSGTSTFDVLKPDKSQIFAKVKI